MKTRKWMPGIMMVGILFASCSQRAYVQKDDTVDFSKIRTYAWVYGTQKDSLSKKTELNSLTETKIKESIDRNLQKNGWKQVSKNPDVLLVYDMDIQRENRTVSDPVYTMPTTRWFYNPYSRRYTPVYYPSEFIGYNNRHESYKEGTLTLTIMKAENEKTIWQGWTSSEINGRRMTDREIDENVKAIIRKMG